MSVREAFRRSSEAILLHFNDSKAQSNVTVSRSAVSLFEAVSGEPATLTASAALEDATSLPMASTNNLAGRLDPGVTLAIAGHSASYTVQASAEPSATSITATISPGLEADVDGEAITLTARALTFTGSKMNLAQANIPDDWVLGAGAEIWALVPTTTAAGAEPRKGDRVTAPIDAVISEVDGSESFEGIQYGVLLTPVASEEAA